MTIWNSKDKPSRSFSYDEIDYTYDSLLDPIYSLAVKYDRIGDTPEWTSRDRQQTF